jgi:hypothetical protein
MPSIRRSTVALLIGVATMAIAAIYTLVAFVALSNAIDIHMAVGGPISQAGGPRPENYANTGAGLSQSAFVLCVVGALVVAAGASASYLVLNPRPKFHARVPIYALFLAIILPASMYNYAQGDTVLPAGYQVALNLGVIFLGSTIVLWLAQTRATAPDTRALKGLVLALLVFGAVLVPATFTVAWAVWRVRRSAEPPHLPWGGVAELSGIASTVIAWATYRLERKRDLASQLGTARIAVGDA